MRAVRKAVLRWGQVTAPIKITPLVDAETHKIPAEIDVHKECHQEVVSENFCPKCEKFLKLETQAISPVCEEAFKPEIRNFCSECHVLVEKPVSGKWCQICQKRLSEEDIKSVFPVGENQFMELSGKERQVWQKTFPDKSEIGVVWIVRRREINPVYFLATYILVPDENGEYGYEFFRQALADDELALVADVVLSKKNYRALIVHEKGRLLLITLVNCDEINWPDIPPVELPADLVEKGRDVMFEMAERQFRPEEHARDFYREHFEGLVAKKVRNQEVIIRPPSVPSTEVVEKITQQIMTNLRNLQESRKETVEIKKKKPKKSRKEAE